VTVDGRRNHNKKVGERLSSTVRRIRISFRIHRSGEPTTIVEKLIKNDRTTVIVTRTRVRTLRQYVPVCVCVCDCKHALHIRTEKLTTRNGCVDERANAPVHNVMKYARGWMPVGGRGVTDEPFSPLCGRGRENDVFGIRAR